MRDRSVRGQNPTTKPWIEAAYEPFCMLDTVQRHTQPTNCRWGILHCAILHCACHVGVRGKLTAVGLAGGVVVLARPAAALSSAVPAMRIDLFAPMLDDLGPQQKCQAGTLQAKALVRT